jgi:hypothetical protein
MRFGAQIDDHRQLPPFLHFTAFQERLASRKPLYAALARANEHDLAYSASKSLLR